MSRSTFTAALGGYIVSPEDPTPPEGRLRAFVVGQAIDDATKLPFQAALEVTANEPGFVVQVKRENWFVIAGITRRQFPALSTAASILHLRLSADGYLPRALTATVPKTLAGQLPALVVLATTATKMHLLP